MLVYWPLSTRESKETFLYQRDGTDRSNGSINLVETSAKPLPCLFV